MSNLGAGLKNQNFGKIIRPYYFFSRKLIMAFRSGNPA